MQSGNGEDRPAGGGSGLPAAIDEVMEGRRPPGAGDQQQLDLLTPEEASAADLLGLPTPRRAVVARPGRPRGAKNRRTQEWIDYLLSKYPSPLEGLLAIGHLGVDELMAHGQSFTEAINTKIRALGEAAPYVHARLTSVELRPPGHPDGPALVLEASDEPFDQLEEAKDVTPTTDQ